jgi:hypothetical protein
MGGSSMSKRRGKRVVVGYVVSLSGKRGGPWESVGPNPTQNVVGRLLFAPEHKRQAVENAKWWRDHPHHGHPHARALPLVRYEVDAEEERLRDAVVDAAVAYDVEAFPGRAGGKYADLIVAVRALRAHREKVGK